MINTPVSTDVSVARVYTDINMLFTTNPFTRDITTKKNEDAVKFAVMNLIMTRKYERPFHPEIASDIQSLLFENYTIMTRALLKRAVEDVIKAFEPRAKIHDVNVNGSNDEVDRNSVLLTIVFSMKSTEKPITFTVNVNRVR